MLEAGYALPVSEKNQIAYDAGDGLIGQLIVTGKPLYLDEIPDGYIKIISGLGSASPRFVFMCPVLNNNEVAGVLELASFTPLSPAQRKQVEEACQLIAEKFKLLKPDRLCGRKFGLAPKFHCLFLASPFLA